MHFDGIETNVKGDEIFDKFQSFSEKESSVECENVSEMDYSESPRSTTSTEFSEPFSIPPQSNDDSDDNDESSPSEDSTVNLPAGV